MTQMIKEDTRVVCGYCGSKYRSEFKGRLCVTCELSEIGLSCPRVEVV